MRTRNPIRRLVAGSIWGDGAVSPKDSRIEHMLRANLPRFDIAVLLFGVLGYFGGIPAIRDTFSEPYAQAWSAALVTTALLCLVGLAYPAQLWRLEFYGKAFLVGLILLYAGAVAIAGIVGGDLGRGAVAAAIYSMTELPRWRLRDIARDREVNGWP